MPVYKKPSTSLPLLHLLILPRHFVPLIWCCTHTPISLAPAPLLSPTFCLLFKHICLVVHVCNCRLTKSSHTILRSSFISTSVSSREILASPIRLDWSCDGEPCILQRFTPHYSIISHRAGTSSFLNSWFRVSTLSLSPSQFVIEQGLAICSGVGPTSLASSTSDLDPS